VNAASAIAVIPARLPYLDRRALSEAWYSALRLARTSGEGAAEPRAPLDAGHAARLRTAREGEPKAPRPGTPGAGCRHRAPQAPAAAAGGRAVAHRTFATAPAARRARAGAPSAHAHVTLTLDGARVRIVARRDGARTQLIALCSVEHVETVRRALDMLERSLRLRGERLDAEIRALPSSRREDEG
jgi:hypothetical protein